MSRHNRKTIQLGLVVLSLIVFLFITGGALGVVWLRQQISRTAERCIAKEKELVIVQRKNAYLRTTIAQVHNPEYLKERLGAKLMVPSNKQIVWMNSDEAKLRMRHLAAKSKNGQGLGTTGNQRRS